MKGMKVLNIGAPTGVLVLNYARSKVAVPSADEVPNLVPKNAMDALMKDDTDPLFKVEAIDFPAKGSGGVYDGSFFKSFINVCKERPIPGSKRGHEYSSRPASDFYTVGGRVDSTDNGKTGTAYLKVYIPPMGDPTENSAFRRDARAGMVHFSLVSRPDFNVKTEKDEMGNPIQVRHFTASMGYERNDAMEYGAGAMAQIVNSSGISLDLDAARALIEAGQVDTQTNVEGEPIQAGRVYRSALRRLASRANEEDRSAIGELISLIDKTRNNGGKPVDKEEALKLLSNLIKNGAESKQDIAKALGIETRGEADVANAAAVETLKNKLGEKPLEKLDAVLTENKAAKDAAVVAAVTEVAGPAKIQNAAKAEIENPAHTYALQKCAGKSGEELKNALDSLKEDQVMKLLNAQRADGGSQLLRSVKGGKKEIVENQGDGIVTHRIGGE